MTTTVLGIYNAALSAARAKGRLSSLTDRSREREECDFWYEQIRDRVQEMTYWPSSRRSERLALLATRNTAIDWAAGDPETQFLYSYALPTSYLRAWFMVDYSPFTISFDHTRERTVINTNTAEAVLVYAASQTNPVHWTAGQRDATIHALAAVISGPISGQSQLQDLNYAIADQAIMRARADAAMAPHFVPETVAPALAARGYSDPFRTRYYYPLAPLFSEAMPNA